MVDTTNHPLPLLAATLLTVVSPQMAAAQTDDGPRAFGALELTVEASHDGMAGRLRQDRSHGASLTAGAMWRPEHWRAGILLDGVSLGLGAYGIWSARMPTRADEPELQRNDLAPTGLLGGGLVLELLGHRDRFTLRYLFAATGQAARGRSLYGTLGDTAASAHTAESEIGQNLFVVWERSWLTALELSGGGHLVDVSTNATTAVGELRIAQSLAATARLGWMLGPLVGTTSVPEGRGWRQREAYVYGTFGIDVVARDMAIDGPLFNDAPHPHDVRARPLVPFAIIGFRLRPWRQVAVGYAIELRGRAVDGPADASPAPAASHALGRLELQVAL